MPGLPDTRRTIGDLIRLGTIDSVDLASSTCRVRVGDIVTGDIEWLSPRAGATRVWSPPTPGEQCVLFCPEGDTEAGFALPGMFSDANPAPSADPLDLIRFEDGAILSYDAAAHHLVVQLPAGGSAEIAAPGGMKITGPVEIVGDLKLNGDATVTGKVSAGTDVVASGKSLTTHKHLGVTAGGGISGPPQ